MLFHTRGKTVVEQIAEAGLKTIGDDLAHFLGVKTAVLQAHIAAVLDGGDNRGVGRGPADTALLQFADQLRLAVARRWRGEVLGGKQSQQGQRIALSQVGQHRIVALASRRRLHPRVAVEAHDAAAGDEFVGAGGDRNARREVLGRGHLAGDELPPDQLVQALSVALHGVELGLQHVNVRGANGFVGFLGVLLRAVTRRFFGQVARREMLRDVVPAGAERLFAEVGRVRAHIGDMAGLVKTLGQDHGLLDPEA